MTPAAADRSSSATPPEVSLIVNTFDKPRHLELVLESIALQEGCDGAMELIVADDGSAEPTAEIVHAFARRVSFPVAFTTEPHDGFRLARVRNRGAALARGRTFLFLDGDSILPPDHVATHLARRRPGWAQLGDVARLSEANSRDLQPGSLAGIDLRGLVAGDELRRLERRHRKARWQNRYRHPSKPRLAGGNFAVWRSDYLRVNGSDERFRGWGQEDDDLGLRLRAAGVRLESILDCTCSYHVWHPSDPSATPRWRDGGNVPYFLRRGRLTRCRVGLETRHKSSILWGLPPDLDSSSLGRELNRLLLDAPRAPAGGECEIDVVIRPGAGRFVRRAECRLLLLEAAAPPRGNAAGLFSGGWRWNAADSTVTVAAGEGALEKILDRIG
jgi:glycosyltransferase involved in cell wall biosynthesis